MNIDEQNDKVAYNDEAHQYWNVDDNENYISVTTLIDRYTQDFNKDFWSKYKALEALIPTEFWKIEKKHLLDTMKIDNKILELYSITEDAFKAKQQDILDEWYRKNKESTDRGTKIHAELEQSIRGGGDNISLQKYGIGGKFKYSGSKGRIDESYGVYPEYLIYRESPDKVLRIAGHIDLLVKDNNDITIIDYKTNASIDKKSGFNVKTKKNQMMKYPLSNLMDCNFYHYTMQLSTYAWMVQQLNPEFNIKSLILVHFPHEGGMVEYHLDYLKDEVEKMLRHYKKEIIQNKQKQKRQRIEF